MTHTKIMLVLLFLTAGTLAAQQPTAKEAKVTPLVSKALADIPGKEVLVLTVEYAPGGSDPIHRHNAHGFIYVLEGTIVMQVKGGKEVRLTQVKLFMKAPTIFMSLAGTRAAPSRQNSWCFC